MTDMDDWKDLEDVSKPCSEENGWCGWCGNCREHSEWLHQVDEWTTLEEDEMSGI